MLEVLDRDMRRVALLERAFDRVQVHRLGGVGELTFSLPEGDAKAAACAPFALVRAEDGTCYRILADAGVRGDTGRLDYTCEHAIATLVDDVLFGPWTLGGRGMPTSEVLRRILEQQTQARWQLGNCEFGKEFEYGFSSENLLNAVFSVPNLFVEAYRWDYDFSVYPWRLSLRRLDTGSGMLDIRAGRNLIASSSARDGGQVCTRLYPLGYGEGDNQLTIREVNGGLPYLQSPPDVIARYGVISRVYVDRQFEDARSLMERGRVLLEAMQTPQYTRRFKVADLYPLAGRAMDAARCGDVARLVEDGQRAYVTGVKRWLDIDGEMELELSTQPRDLAADIADLADRQRIEQVYAQGATQIYAQSVQANADRATAAELRFMIPREMRIVNKVRARISLEPFRSYSRATAGGGRAAQTSGAGGGSTATSGAGGGGAVTTSAAGQTTLSAAQTVTLDRGVGFTTDASSLTVSGEAHPSYPRDTGGAGGYTGSATSSSTGSASGGNTGSGGGARTGGSRDYTGNSSGSASHSHYMYHTHDLPGHVHAAPAHTHSFAHSHGLNAHTHPIGGHRHHISHTHSIFHQHTLPGHAHSLPAHSHSVTIPRHSHTLTLGNHSHSITLPEHSHTIEQGIYRFGSPRGASVLVGGVARATMGREIELDLTPHLAGSGGKIPRDVWIRLGVLPDDLAYVTIDLMIQGFVQSRGGGTY